LATELTALPLKYREALAKALAYAREYNLPLIKPIPHLHFLVIWGPRERTITKEKRAQRNLFDIPKPKKRKQ
jgi:hypothetical protein